MLRILTELEARGVIIVEKEVAMVVVEAESVVKRRNLENEDQNDIVLMEEV